jgi:hypothetical protein
VSIAAKTPMRHLRPIARPVLRSLSLNRQQTWFYDILTAQIKHYNVDILLNQAMDSVEGRFLLEMKPHVKMLIGQIASPLPQNEDFRIYDLVISSLPNLVEHFRNMGIPSELNRLAFEPRVLQKLKNNNGDMIPVSFVGNLFQAHASRVVWLEHLCRKLDISIWGTGIESLPANSPIRGCYNGQAWGVNMFQILHRSKITLNHHGDVAPYANNMRLYEATGVGALLVTDWKPNLHEMFEPGKEVVAYRTREECAEFIQYYLEHDEQREAIARAGQARTLREHTYYKRMQELVKIVMPLLYSQKNRG